MKPQTIYFIWLILFCAGWLHAQPQGNEIQITYIANEGFLVQSPHHKILIDALFSGGYGLFSIPPKEVIKRIIDANPPFDSVDACFLTHYHKDHCDPALIQEYLKKYPRMILVTTKPSLVFIDGEQFGFVQLENQFCEMTPELNQSSSHMLGDMRIKALGIKHLSFYQHGVDLEEYMFNVGYYLDMDGMTIFHSGDIKMNNLQDYIAKNGTWTDTVDVALLYYELLNAGVPI